MVRKSKIKQIKENLSDFLTQGSLKSICIGIFLDLLLIGIIFALVLFVKVYSNNLSFLLGSFPELTQESPLHEVSQGGQVMNALVLRFFTLWIGALIFLILAWSAIKYLIYSKLSKKDLKLKSYGFFVLQTIIYWILLLFLVYIFKVALFGFYQSLAPNIAGIVFQLSSLVILVLAMAIGTPFLLTNSSSLRSILKNSQKITLINTKSHLIVVAGLIISNLLGILAEKLGLGTFGLAIIILTYVSWVRVHYARDINKLNISPKPKKSKSNQKKSIKSNSSKNRGKKK